MNCRECGKEIKGTPFVGTIGGGTAHKECFELANPPKATAAIDEELKQAGFMSDTDKIIKELFSTRWSGDLSDAPIEDMRKQLHKSLTDQVRGYWSGHTAYSIMVDGGFLVDSKRVRVEGSNMAKGKKLTVLGQMFMKSMESGCETNCV